MDFSRYRAHRPNPSPHRPQLRQRLPLALLALGWLVAAMPARADNPGYDRPGLGFNPAVLDPGELTLEQGLPSWSQDHEPDYSSSQYTADSLLRLGLGRSLELQVGGSSYNDLRQTTAAGTSHRSGHGDSSLALKLALPSSNTSFTWGVLGSVEFTDGARAFRNAQRQYLLGMALGWQNDPANSTGAYLEDVRGGGRDSYTVAINRSHAFTPNLTLFAEAAWQHQPGSAGGTLAGAGVAWQVDRRVQLDAGFRHRLSGPLPDWWAGLGASVFFGR
ncbi:MAG TPA: transporter [Rhodanobacter sp.]|nr:transporter [Rhodanobacter sp.]